MNVKTKIFKEGHIFYKGFSESRNNTKILSRERYFFVAQKENHANIYTRNDLSGHVCQYELTKPVRLMKITEDNIQKVLKETNNKAIAFAFSYANKNTKNALLKQLVDNYSYRQNKNLIPPVSQRMSFLGTNKIACRGLCAFFKEKGIDGYYFKGDDTFHEEVMLCNASKLLQVKCYKTGGKRVNANTPLVFAKNIMNKPNAKLENVKQFENFPNVNTRKRAKNKVKELLLRNIPKADNTKRLNYLSKFKPFKNENVKKAIEKRRNILALPNKLVKLFAEKAPPSKFYVW
jgi:hypothetical protein